MIKCTFYSQKTFPEKIGQKTTKLFHRPFQLSTYALEEKYSQKTT